MFTRMNNKPFTTISELIDLIENDFQKPKKEKSLKTNYSFNKEENKNVITLDALGYTKEEIKIDYESSTSILTISGELREENIEKFKYLDAVLPEFKQKFKCVVPIDEDGIKAEFINGVVIVNIPFIKKDNKTINFS